MIKRIKKLLTDSDIEYRSIEKTKPTMHNEKYGINKHLFEITLNYLTSPYYDEPEHEAYIVLYCHIYLNYHEYEYVRLCIDEENINLMTEVPINKMGETVKKIIALLEVK